MGQLAIVFGGPSPEHDISILTGLLSERVLRDAGHDVAPLYWTRAGDWVLCPARRRGEGLPRGRAARGDPAGGGPRSGVPAAEEGPRRRPSRWPSTLPSTAATAGPARRAASTRVFDQLGIPLTGGPAPLAALGMDKLAFGAVLQSATASRRCRGLRCRRPRSRPSTGPYIVKPRFGGSSIGIEVVEDLDTARALAKS